MNDFKRDESYTLSGEVNLNFICRDEAKQFYCYYQALKRFDTSGITKELLIQAVKEISEHEFEDEKYLNTPFTLDAMIKCMLNKSHITYDQNRYIIQEKGINFHNMIYKEQILPHLKIASAKQKADKIISDLLEEPPSTPDGI